MAQHANYAAFEEAVDDWQEAPSVAVATPVKGKAAAAAAPALKSPPSLTVVDPFEEAVFPTPQTPVKMQPRQPAAIPPSQVKAPQQPQQQQSSSQAAVAAAPAPAPAASPVRKRCAFGGCTNDRFARGYCALHLSDISANPGAGAASASSSLSVPASASAASAAAPTPTTRIRAKHKLWSADIREDRTKHLNECVWRLVHNDDSHTVNLVDNTFVGSRVVTINGREVYSGTPDLGPWKLDATIGHSFKDSLNLRVLVDVGGSKGYEYKLYVEGLEFSEAHQAFLAKLSGASALQRAQLSEQAGEQAIDDLKAHQLQDAVYIKSNWQHATAEEKTAAGYSKSKVSWSFTVRGSKHILVLEYHMTTGKKKLLLDGKVLAEEKPSVLSAHKHRRWTHKFAVDGVQCEVETSKNKEATARDKPHADGHHHKAAAASRPILFSFKIDGVPFESCTQTETDLAGGNVDLDQRAAQLVKRASLNSNNASGSGGGSVPVQVGRRNSTHTPLTAEEYEEAMRDKTNDLQQQQPQQGRPAARDYDSSSSDSSDDSSDDD